MLKHTHTQKEHTSPGDRKENLRDSEGFAHIRRKVKAGAEIRSQEQDAEAGRDEQEPLMNTQHLVCPGAFECS